MLVADRAQGQFQRVVTLFISPTGADSAAPGAGLEFSRENAAVESSAKIVADRLFPFAQPISMSAAKRVISFLTVCSFLVT